MTCILLQPFKISAVVTGYAGRFATGFLQFGAGTVVGQEEGGVIVFPVP